MSDSCGTKHNRSELLSSCDSASYTGNSSSKCSLRKDEHKTDIYNTITFILNQLVNISSDLDSSSEKEEKAIAAIKKEPIQVDQFLQRLRQKKLDKYLNFEVRVSRFCHFVR